MKEMKTNIMGMSREEIIYDLFKNRVNAGRIGSRADLLTEAKEDFNLLVMTGIIKVDESKDNTKPDRPDLSMFEDESKTAVFVIRIKVTLKETGAVEYHYVTGSYGRQYYYQKGEESGFDATLVSTEMRFETIDDCRREISKYDFRMTSPENMNVTHADKREIEDCKCFI